MYVCMYACIPVENTDTGVCCVDEDEDEEDEVDEESPSRSSSTGVVVEVLTCVDF